MMRRIHVMINVETRIEYRAGDPAASRALFASLAVKLYVVAWDMICTTTQSEDIFEVLARPRQRAGQGSEKLTAEADHTCARNDAKISWTPTQKMNPSYHKGKLYVIFRFHRPLP